MDTKVQVFPARSPTFFTPIPSNPSQKLKNLFDYPFTELEIISVTIFLIEGIIHCLVFQSYLHLDIVKHDPIRFPLFYTLSILTPITGCYAAIVMKLNQGTCFNLTRFILFVFIPIIGLITNISIGAFFVSFEVPVVYIFVPITVTGLAAFKVIKKELKIVVGDTVGEILMIAVNILFSLWFNLAISGIFVENEGLTDPAVVVKYTAVVYFLILVLIWGIIHLFVFRKSPNEIDELRTQVIGNKGLSMKVQVILQENPDILNTSKEGILSKYGHLLASFGIISSVLGIEIGLVTVILDYNSGNYPISAIYLSIFYVFAVPGFLFGGVIYSSSRLNLQDKYLVVILLFTFVPTTFIMLLSYYLYTFDSTHYLGMVIGIGFPGALIYWMAVSMIHTYNKRSFQYFSSVLCLSFVIPIGLILPLYYAGGMKKATFWAVELIFFFFGTLVLILWVIQLLLRISKKIFMLLVEMNSFNVKDVSTCIYSCSFILGFSLIAWLMIKKVDNKDWHSGLLFGFLVVLGVLIVNSLILHRIRMYQKDPDVNEESINQILEGKKCEKSEVQEKYLVKKRKVQSVLVACELLVIVGVSIPMLILGSDSSKISAAIILSAGVFSLLIFLLLLELKHFLKKFGESVISYTLGYCWLFCFIPLIVLVPVTLSSTTNISEEREVTSWSIGCILLIFMVGVSISAITLNFVFRRLEYEKIAKFCCLQVQEKLGEHGVKASLENLRAIFDNFYNSKKEVVEKVLVGKTVYSYRELNKEPDLKYSKEILTLRELAKVKIDITEENPGNEKKVNIFYCFRKLCGKKQKNNIKSQLNPEELIGIKDLEFEDYPKIETPAIPAQNWDTKFKQDAENIIKTQKALRKTIKIKSKLGFDHQSPLKLDNIPLIRLSTNNKTRLMNSNELNYLLTNTQAKNIWLEVLFGMFSSGLISHDGQPWMTLSDLRSFIRLSGLSKSINSANIDILYVNLTRRYNPLTSMFDFVKLGFEEFSNSLLPELARILKMVGDTEELKDRLIKEQLYPQIVTNVPDLKLEPEESDFEDLLDEKERKWESEKNKGDEEEGKENKRKESKGRVFSIKTGRGTVKYSEFSESLHSFRALEPKIQIKAPEFHPPSVPCSKFFDKFSTCTSSIFKSLLSCCGKILDLGVEILSQTKPSTLQTERYKETLLDRRVSPNWEEICKITIERFDTVYKEATKKQNQASLYITMNFENISGIAAHIVEIYSFSSFAFSNQIGWVYGSSFTNTSTVVLADDKYWFEMYWVSFAAGILFLILLYPTLKLVRKGRLGLNADYTIAEFPSSSFWLSKFTGLLGNTMYLTMMCAILSAFSCVYSENSWHLLRNSSIECFSNEHIPYFVLSILMLFLYYPTATLLYPNFTYQDKALDIKFDTSYLVLESQGKMLIAGVSVFFAKEDYIILQLIVSIGVSLVLFVICLKMKPCLISSYNLWKTGGFLVPVWSCLCALVKYYTDYEVLAVVLMVVGVGGIAGGIFLMQWKMFGLGCGKSWKVRVKAEENVDVIECVKEEEKESIFGWRMEERKGDCGCSFVAPSLVGDEQGDCFVKIEESVEF